jgi:dihydroxyacetone kinase-like protein
MTREQFRGIWIRFRDLVEADKDHLNALDAAIGDADHGTNMSRGLLKVGDYVASAEDSLQKQCRTIGMTLLSTVGGASGALWGSALLKASQLLPDLDECSVDEWLAALKAGVGAVQDRGKAQRGDKTMLDVWLPAVDRLEEALSEGNTPAVALGAVAQAAPGWAEATVPMQARRGRAAYLGPRSVGHMDPGAASTVLWWRAVAEEANAT